MDDLGENLKKMSVISFPEAPKGNEENEGDQTLVPDQQYPPSQIFQTQPSELLIFMRYCINDNNFYSWTRRKGNFSVLEEARLVYVSLKSKTKSPYLVQRKTSTGWLLD